jgi:hypothetical protein
MRLLVIFAFLTSVLSGAGIMAVANPPAEQATGPGPWTGPRVLPDPEMKFFADDAHKQCGDYSLVFRNKDLREDANDFIHAQGQFFIQFQAVGKGAKEITRFSFSFGATADVLHNTALLNCNKQIPPTAAGQGTAGAYLLYYRSDFDGKDGFFVPILTRNVPDGDYAAAVHAYAGECNPVGPTCVEVARAWARAKVDNCPTDIANGISAHNCAQDPASEIVKKDRTLPWPIILPGDGVQTNNVEGLTIEFPEPMVDESVEAFLNGEPLRLAKWNPPSRDSDLIPLNDDVNCPNPPNGIKYLCERVVYGPGWKWEGAIKNGDVIRVRGEDHNRNLLERTIHVGAATSSGWVELLEPELAVEMLNDDDAFIRPGDHHEFNLRITNIGGGEAHTSLTWVAETESGTDMRNTSVDAYFAELDGTKTQHIVVQPGIDYDLKFVVETRPETPMDHYYIHGVLEYDVAGEPKSRVFDVIVDVNPEASGNHQHLHNVGLKTTEPSNETAAPQTTQAKDTPGPGLLLGALAVAGVLVVVRRRRA